MRNDKNMEKFMLKKVLAMLCLIAVASLSNCMEAEIFQEQASLNKQKHLPENFTESIKAKEIFNRLTPHIKNQEAETAIQILCENRKLWPTLFLVSTDEDGNNLLHLACINHCYDLIGYLMANDFPRWRINSNQQTVYEVPCIDSENCVNNKGHKEYLLKQHTRKPTRNSIINRGGTLGMQFEIAQLYPLKKNDLENLIEDLIKAHQFIEAEALAKSSRPLNLKASLVCTLKIEKKYPRNKHIDELIEALLSKITDNDLVSEEKNSLLRYQNRLKTKYNNAATTKTTPSILVKSKLQRKKTRSSFNNKIVIVGIITIIGGLALYKIVPRTSTKTIKLK